MTALRKILVEEEPVVATKAARAPTPNLYVVTGTPPAEAGVETETMGDTLKNIVLFFAAPFVGLAYVIALPLVGLALLAVMAARAAARLAAVHMIGRALRTIAMFIAAPFIGLAYMILLPFVGLAVLAWMGGRAVVAAPHIR